MVKETEHRLLARTVKYDGGCWICNYHTSGGYPKMRYKGKMVGAHRVAHMIWIGPIPEGLDVLHSCDTPRCVNPSHLWAGTHLENMKDMMNKGRHNPVRGDKHPARMRIEQMPRGEQHKSSKLTEEHIRYIKMWGAEGFKKRAIARSFGISHMHVSRILNGETWKHLL